ncbi:MAG: transglycosylase domain-containing protein [Aerococcus sp.]|nr:transglycosylase domain-containing protein [Aerococcus sp.]
MTQRDSNHERPVRTDEQSHNTANKTRKRTDQRALYQSMLRWSGRLGTRLRRLFWGLVLLLLAGGTLGLGLAGGYFIGLVETLPQPNAQEIRQTLTEVSETSEFLDRDGKHLSDIHSDLDRRTLKNEDLPKIVKEGLIATEDENFPTHPGVVPSALIRAALSQIFKGNNPSGGSTITQQLIKQQLLTNERSLDRKAREMLLALHAEKYLSKDDIITAYLNVSPFGRNYQGKNIAGIETAAQGIFGVSAKDLTLSQASYLVGMPQNPYNYSPYTPEGTLKDKADLKPGLERQQYVLERMYIEGYITAIEYDKAKNEDVTQSFRQPVGKVEDEETTIDPYLYQALEQEAIQILAKQIAESEQINWDTVDKDTLNRLYQQAQTKLSTGGLQVESSIDPILYQQLNQQMQNTVSGLGTTYTDEVTDENGKKTTITEGVQNGAVLMDNATGEVLAFVAGRDFNKNQVDHAFASRRQPGSALKPILTYGPALEEGIAGPSSILPDTTIRWQQEDGSYYEPKNFGATVSNQLLTYRYALAHSLNNPTIYLYRELLDRHVDIKHYAEAMGLKQAIDPSEYKNMALPIGGLATGPTVAEVTGAFAVFANGGTYHQPHLIKKITTKQGDTLYSAPSEATRVFSEDTAYVVGDVLREVWKTGTFAPVKDQLPAHTDWYIKTGTSEDFNDLWVAGSTPTITLVSWGGYDNQKTKHTFIDSAANLDEPGTRHDRYWAGLLNALYSSNPSLFGVNQSFYRPKSVTEKQIIPQTGTLPGKITTPNGTMTLPDNRATQKELFTKNFQPPKASFDFAIQATDEDKMRQLQSLGLSNR